MTNMTGQAHIEAKAYAGVYKDAAGILDMVDNFDRPPKAYLTEGGYTYIKDNAVGFENKHGKRIPKAELAVVAGIFHARAECSILEAEAKGPNVYAGIKASPVTGIEAMFKLELASVSLSDGRLKVKAGLSADTGAGIGPTGLEVRLLGTGFTIGPRVEFTVFGSGFEFNLL